MTEYRSPVELVREFHTTYGQVIRTEPLFDVPEKTMRHSLIDEEVGELTDAYADHDFVEVIDALADIVYVAVGMAITHGITLNLVNGPFLFLEPSHATSFEEGTNFANRMISLNYELHKAQTVGEIKIALEDIIEYAYSAAAYYGVDLDEILEEVQASNLSKLGRDENGDNTVVLRREDGKILKGPDFFVPNIAGVLARQKERGLVTS
jgi:predicted HAD superfamily Cof-like phosphohydrolase